MQNKKEFRNPKKWENSKSTASIQNNRFRDEEFIFFMNTLSGKDKVMAAQALAEISRLRDRLQQERHHKEALYSMNSELKEKLSLEKYRLLETQRFFRKWAEGFAKLLKSPINLENDTHLRHHYFILRDSIKNLVQNYREKFKEIK